MRLPPTAYRYRSDWIARCPKHGLPLVRDFDGTKCAACEADRKIAVIRKDLARAGVRT